MFGLLKRENSYEQSAQDAYVTILAQVREPVFYSEYGVPDSFDGRFDVLMLHMFIVLHAINETGDARGEFGQALFDACFVNMDQTLREIGIGDMGIHKHMKRMLKGYNGRMNAYEAALDDQTALAEALQRNVYGTIENPSKEGVQALAGYVQTQINALKGKQLDALYMGQIEFISV